MGLEAIDGMLPLPTRPAKILEALEVSAEVRPHHTIAHGAERVLQIWVNLNLQETEDKESITVYERSLQKNTNKLLQACENFVSIFHQFPISLQRIPKINESFYTKL